MRHLVPVLLLISVLTAPAAARSIFVNNTIGDDLYNGHFERPLSDRDGPVQTITKALRIANAGDRIVIANTGVAYRESLTVQGGRHSGSEWQPFVIDGGGATIDGSVPIPADAWEFYREGIFRFRPRRLQYQQLFVDGQPIAQRPVHQLALALPELQPLEWTLWQGHVYFRVEQGRLPESYPLSLSGQPTGLTLYQVRHVIVANLVIQGFSVDGINVHDGFGPCQLVGLNCRANGRSGIGVAGATRLQINQCLAADNGLCQLYLEGLAETYLNKSDLVPTTGPAWIRKSGSLVIDGEPVDAVQDQSAELVRPKVLALSPALAAEPSDQPLPRARLR